MSSMIIKKIRVDYYRINAIPIEKKDLQNVTSKPFDLQKWLVLFSNEYMDLDKRIIPYMGENIRLEHISYNDTNMLWELTFVRLRSNNLPRWAYTNKESVDISLTDDEYIGEDVCMIYDPGKSIVCLQRNQNSISKNGIVVYMNQIWNHRDGHIIQLDPIINNINIENIRKWIPRKLRIKCAVSQYPLDDYGMLNHMFDVCKNIGGSAIDVSMSVGRVKHGQLNIDDVMNIIDLMQNDGNCEALALTYKETEDAKTAVLDILKCVVSDYIEVHVIPKRTIPHSVVLHEMAKQYNERRSLL